MAFWREKEKKIKAVLGVKITIKIWGERN